MRQLTEQDFKNAALSLGVPVATIKAVSEVESKGGGFLSDGRRPKILFEAHIFARLTNGRYNRTHPTISSARWNKTLYAKTGAGEHRRLELAMSLDRDAALQSCSWGRFQTMGFNFRRAGFSNLKSFINAMHKNEGEHLLAFCAVVKSMGADDELRNLQWGPFALIYNGPRYAENKYDIKLAAAYKRHNTGAA